MPKKKLGQNFLVDRNIQRKIIAACEFSPKDIVVEIGAGRGELTKLISERVHNVYALEIDAVLCAGLRESLSENLNVKVICGDILKFDFKKFLGRQRRKIKVVGNIPYYISSPIIEQLFKYNGIIKEAFITVQKEFAERLVASPGSKRFGSLSCFLQYSSTPSLLFSISKHCFYPEPKVDSSFLKLELKKQRALKKTREGLLFRIIRAAFNKRRKTLRNSLKQVICARKLERFFAKYLIDRNTRPEDLSLADFIHLAKL